MAVSMSMTPDGIRIFRVRGKLVASSMDELKAALDAAGEKAYVVVNLKGAHMADSVAVGYLLHRRGVLYRGGGALSLCCLHPTVSKLLAMAGLNKLFIVHDQEDDAIAALRMTFSVPVPPPKKRGRKPKEKKPGSA